MTGTNETLNLRPFNVTGAKKKRRGQLKRRQRRAVARSAGSKKPSVRRKRPKFSQQHVPDIPATRTSDLEIGSPRVDVLSRVGEGLTPPPKHPNRPQGSKRKHSEVIDGAIEEPEGKKKRQRQEEAQQAMTDMSLVVSDMDRIVQPVEDLADLTDVSVLPVEPVPAENVNSLGDGAGYDPHQIPDILSDDGFSPPSIDIEAILDLHLP
ncbi:hypothetical protein MANI_000889 [Metarhizium anisopliae]